MEPLRHFYMRACAKYATQIWFHRQNLYYPILQLVIDINWAGTYEKVIVVLGNSNGSYQRRDSYMSQRMTKPTKWHVRPAKTQISLDIRSVWSKSSLSAWRKHGSWVVHWAHFEDSDQTGRMPRLIWVFAGRTCHFVGFVMHCLYVYVSKSK